MSTPYGPVESESPDGSCPECGAIPEWIECCGRDGKGCTGTITCICEGMCGYPRCPKGCEV